MREDIPSLLRDAAADPSHTPDFDALAARGRRQHLAARVGTALVAVVALVAGGLVLWPDDQPARGPVIGAQPSAPDPEERPTLPAGWHEIELGGAVLGVPGDWTVEVFGEPVGVCPNTAERPTAFVMRAGPQTGGNRCVTIAQRAPALEAAPLSTVPPAVLQPDEGLTWNGVTTTGGVVGERLVRGEAGRTVAYRFPTLDLWLQFTAPDPIGPWADEVLATLAAAATAGSPTETPRPCPEDEADAVIEWASVVRIGHRTMNEVGDAAPVAREQLGRQLLETRCRIADEAGTDYELQSGDATFLEPGTPIHAIAGIDPGFRVVADDGAELRLFQVSSADDADTGADVFDIEGRVTHVEATRNHVVDGSTATGRIRDAAAVRQLVDALLDASVTPERQPSTNEVTYRLTIHLRQGPPLELLLYPADNLIGHPWLTVPATLVDQVEQGVGVVP